MSFIGIFFPTAIRKELSQKDIEIVHTNIENKKIEEDKIETQRIDDKKITDDKFANSPESILVLALILPTFLFLMGLYGTHYHIVHHIPMP